MNAFSSDLRPDECRVEQKGDRKGRLYYDTTRLVRPFIVEATLAVAFLTSPSRKCWW